MRRRLRPHTRAAKTLPSEGHRAPRVRGPGAAPQPRRRSDRFDSTLGFPGEGPSQLAGATQPRPRVFRGNGSHQKVISLPSQAVSLFIRRRPQAPLIQGPTGPDMPLPPSTVRRLFPAASQEEQFSMPDSGIDDSPMEENLKSGQYTPATTRLGLPPPEQTGLGVHDTFPMETDTSTPTPLDTSTTRQPDSAPTSRTTVRPRKRQKTLQQADGPRVDDLKVRWETKMKRLFKLQTRTIRNVRRSSSGLARRKDWHQSLKQYGNPVSTDTISPTMPPSPGSGGSSTIIDLYVRSDPTLSNQET